MRSSHLALFGVISLLFCGLHSSMAVDVVIETDESRQTIAGFGASITGNSDVRVPVYASEAFRDYVAFDLGLSILRMQIEPVLSPTEIADPEDISYNDFILVEGGAAAVTIDFARALIDRDPAIRVIGTAWSAPRWMKENGRTHGTQSGFLLSRNRGYDDDNRLRDDRYDHYAKFLVEYTKMLEAKGTPLYGISPQNELMFTQYFDSAMYTGDEYAKIVRKLGQRYESEGMQRPLIFGPEDMTQAYYNTSGSGADATRHNPYVDSLMAPGTAEYFDAWATHGYTDGVNAGGTMDPGRYWENIKQFNRPYWITEGGTGGHDWPAPITSGIAAYLHYALVAGNVELFTGWQVQDPEPSTHSIMAWDTPTKKTHAAAHFWRFIRPGFIRVDTRFIGLNGSLRVSAYKDPGNERLVVVAINPTSSQQTLDLTVSGTLQAESLQGFQTTASFDLKELGSINAIDGKFSSVLPAYSITTLAELQPVQAFSLDATVIQVERGLSGRLVGILDPVDASNRRITWSSSDPTIATVDGGGRVAGLAEGNVTVTATTEDGGFTATAEVQVLPRSEWIWADWNVQDGFSNTGAFLGWLYIPYKSDWVYSYGIGSWLYLPQSSILEGYAWTYFRDPQQLAQVLSAASSTQHVVESTASSTDAVHVNVAAGKTISYSASSAGSPEAGLIDGNTSTASASRWSVEVYPQWALIDLEGLYEISQFRLYPLENRGYAYKVEVSQDGESFHLAVDRRNNRQGGLVISDMVDVMARYVMLTVTGGGNYSGPWISIGEFEVIGAEAIVPVAGVFLSHSAITRGVGQSWRLSATVQPVFASNKSIVWSSSNSDVASVDATGRVMAMGVGNATITVTTEEGAFAASTEVSVSESRRWARWDLEDGKYASTGSFAGTLYVDKDHDWVYSYGLSTWIHLPEESIANGGAWGVVLRE